MGKVLKLWELLQQPEARSRDPDVFVQTLQETLALVPSRDEAVELLSEKFDAGTTFVKYWVNGNMSPSRKRRQEILEYLAQRYAQH